MNLGRGAGEKQRGGRGPTEALGGVPRGRHTCELGPRVPAPSPHTRAPTSPLQTPETGPGGRGHRSEPPTPGSRKALGVRQRGNSIEFSFGYILKAKVSQLDLQSRRGGRGPSGGGVPQPRHPREHASNGVAMPSVSSLPPPTAPTKRSPPGPQGCTFSGSQLSYGSGGRGEGREGPNSLTGTVAVTRAGGPLMDPQFVPFVFRNY